MEKALFEGIFNNENIKVDKDEKYLSFRSEDGSLIKYDMNEKLEEYIESLKDKK